MMHCAEAKEGIGEQRQSHQTNGVAYLVPGIRLGFVRSRIGARRFGNKQLGIRLGEYQRTANNVK